MTYADHKTLLSYNETNGKRQARRAAVRKARANDVDVGPAGDGNPDVTEMSADTVSSVPRNDDMEPDDTPAADADDDTCHERKALVPPQKKGCHQVKGRRSYWPKTRKWVQCETCHRW